MGATTAIGVRSPQERLVDAIRAPVSWQTAMAFVFFAGIATATRLLADLSPADAAQSFLLPEALEGNISLAAGGFAAVVLLATIGRGSALVRWEELDRGSALRVFAGLVMFFLAWRYVAAEYDYVHEQWHTPDRLLLLAAALLAVFRPVFLLLFILEIRILQAPIRDAFDFAPATTPDHLPILALIALAAVVFVAIATGSRRTEALVPLLGAAITIQFFEAGGSMLELEWLTDNDLTNAPLNGHQQGWLGSGDGSFADLLSQLIDLGRWPILAAIVVLQVGAVVLVVRRRLLMAALLGWVALHVVVMATYGFSLLEWAIVELALYLLLSDPVGEQWSAPAFRVIPVVLVVLAVVFGGAVVKPPDLVRFDGPITYAYEFNGFDTEGNDRRLVSIDFAPHDPVFAFAELHLGPTPATAAGYGALDREGFEQFELVNGLPDVEVLEAAVDPAGADDDLARSVENISRFLRATSRERSPFDYLPNPLRSFWTSRPGQNYDDRTELVELTVTRVTTLRLDGGGAQRRREPVCTFFIDGGEVEVIWHTAG